MNMGGQFPCLIFFPCMSVFCASVCFLHAHDFALFTINVRECFGHECSCLKEGLLHTLAEVL